MSRRLVAAAVVALAFAGAATGSVGRDAAVEASLKARLGKGAVCTVVLSTVRLVECYTPATGRPTRAVTAFADCAGAACRAGCTYRVSVNAGAPLKPVSTSDVNVCRKGWAAATVRFPTS